MQTKARHETPCETGDGPPVKLTNVILASVLMLAVTSWAQESAPPDGRFLPPGLAPGDQVNVHMYDFPDLGGGGVSVHVGADGSIHLPYAGTLQVSGMSPSELEQAVSDSLRTKGIVKQPNVTIDVISALNMTVNVLGQVLSPKAIPLYAPAPLSFVLTQVGGINGFADHHLTVLHHSDQLPSSVEYDPEKPTSAALNYLIYPGDIVEVTSRGVFFVGGEVNHPGVFPMGGAISVGQATPASGEGVVKDMTLLVALTQAGGITAIAARSKLHILRMEDGKRVDIQVNQDKLAKGEVPDPILHPNDIVYIPPSFIRQTTNNLFTTALSGLYAVTALKSANF
jgi:polysaccharide export outer membrane protein